MTPLKAIELGLSVDVDALDSETKQTLASELQVDPTGHTSALLNNPETTAKLD